MRIDNCFHASLLLPYHPNNNDLFPSHCLEMLGPVVTEEDQEKHFIDRILDKHRRGQGMQYLVQWCGYGSDHDE